MNMDSSNQSTETEIMESSDKKKNSGRWQKFMPMVMVALQIILIVALIFTLVTVNKLGALQAQNAQNSVDNFGLIDEKIGTLVAANNDLESQLTGVQGDVSSMALLLNGQSNSTEQDASIGQPMAATLNLTFVCVDSQTKVEITPCTIQVQILDRQPIDMFEASSGQTVYVPTKFRFSITANAEGYQPESEIFEYIEKGVAETHPIECVKE